MTQTKQRDLTLKVGQLAYYDSFFGPIPCKVTAITGESGLASTSQAVTVVLTASRGTYGVYKQGEQIETNGLHVFPRNASVTRGGIRRILPYRIEVL
jgi:hypothetical protein